MSDWLFDLRPALARPCLGWVLALGMLCAVQSGCVHRRMTIRTNPPGAVVYVDDYEIGTTPVATDFVYYGTRKIRLVKDGCETQTVMQKIPAPWYQIPPLDFISENLVPGEIRDHRTLNYQMQPQMIVPTERLLDRAEGLRARAHASAATALPPSAPEGFVPGVPGGVPAPPPSGVPSATPPGSQTPGGFPVYPLAPNGR